MTDWQSVAVGQRFFLYFGQMHVHLPLYAAERFTKESENGDFGACMAEADWACAVIAAELDRLGIREDTLFLFTSDNGSRGDHGASNAPLRGGKFTTWEGDACAAAGLLTGTHPGGKHSARHLFPH